MIFTKLFRALVCVGLLLVLEGCDQEKESSAPDPKAQEIQNAARLRVLTTGLELTGEQQAKVKALILAENQEIIKVNEEATRTGGDRVLLIQAARKITYEKIRPLLTPDQSGKYDALLKKLQSRKK